MNILHWPETDHIYVSFICSSLVPTKYLVKLGLCCFFPFSYLALTFSIFVHLLVTIQFQCCLKISPCSITFPLPLFPMVPAVSQLHLASLLTPPELPPSLHLFLCDAGTHPMGILEMLTPIQGTKSLWASMPAPCQTCLCAQKFLQKVSSSPKLRSYIYHGQRGMSK